jgi:MFS family permease
LTDALATIKDEGEESWNEKQDEKQALLEGYKGEDMLDPYFIGNRGIFASYIAVGFCIYFTVTPITFYLVDDMDANAAQVAVVIGLMSLPWALKLVCGFISDSFPIYGLRRKPYYAIGWASYIICNLILVVLRKPSIGPLAAFVFLMTFSFVQADVCTDAMIVERSKAFETQETRGTLQAQGYIARFFSGVFGAVLGATLYNKDDWGWGLPIWAIFLVNAAVPACLVIPNFFSIVEMNSEVPPKLQIQVAAIWKLLQRRAVWQPASFIFLYNMLVLQNPAWNNFLINGLSFSNFEVGLLTVAGAVLSFVALVIYKAYLFGSPWRSIYFVTTVFGMGFNLLQLVLTTKWNEQWGSAGTSIYVELLFAMGSYGMVQFIIAIQFLPACRMFLSLCPDGAEGASYAMLTTLSNLATTLAYSIAAGLSKIWDVSNTAIEAGDYSGMTKLTILVSLAILLALPFLVLLPNTPGDLKKLQDSDSSSARAGALFFTAILSSILFIIVITILTVLNIGPTASDDDGSDDGSSSSRRLVIDGLDAALNWAVDLAFKRVSSPSLL